MKEFIDQTEIDEGTDINRANLMAAQGFQRNTTVFGNGFITETNGDGELLTTTFNNDGSITEVFVGEKTVTKNTVFTDTRIEEYIS